MSITSGITNSHFIGLKNLHVAKLVSDDATGATYDEFISMPEITQINIEPANQTATLYADDQSVDSANTVSQYKITVNMAGLPLEYKAFLLGHDFKNGVMSASKDDVAPFVAIAFESMKSNGKVRYSKFLKVKFSEPKENPQTKGESIKYNTPSIEGTAIYRSFDSLAYQCADEEGKDIQTTTADNWYKTVDEVKKPASAS